MGEGRQRGSEEARERGCKAEWAATAEGESTCVLTGAVVSAMHRGEDEKGVGEGHRAHGSAPSSVRLTPATPPVLPGPRRFSGGWESGRPAWGEPGKRAAAVQQ